MTRDPITHRPLRPVIKRLKDHLTQQGISGDTPTPFPSPPRGAMTPKLFFANAYISPPFYFIYASKAVAMSQRSVSSDFIATIPVIVIPSDGESVKKIKIKVASAMAYGPDAVLAMLGLKVKPTP